MNIDKQQIAIAEYCGWKEIGKSGVYQNTDKGINGCMPYGEVHKKRIKMKLPGANSFLVPDYLNDLNAIHEALQYLKDNYTSQDFQKARFINHLENIVSSEVPNSGWSFALTTATAAQKAEAFLKTIGKWEE
jgi:hypothetical protein